MKKVFLFLFLFIGISYSNTLNLSKQDIIILKKIKTLSDDMMMQYSLMAIAIRESNLGKNQINHKSKDYGLFQCNIKTVLRRHNVKNTKENRRYFANKLIQNVAFATANAIIELQYWQKVHKKNWIRTWSSYNTGWNYKSKTGFNYAGSILKIIKKLKFEYNL